MTAFRYLLLRMRQARWLFDTFTCAMLAAAGASEHAWAASADSPRTAIIQPENPATTVQWVGQFESPSGTPPPPWQIVQPNGHVPPTHDRVREWQGVRAVEAIAHASMALLTRPLAIDIARTPVLCWRWRVDAPVPSADLSQQSGDDFAARVYVAFRMHRDSMSALTRLKLRIGRSLYGQLTPDASVIYVWDNTHPIGTARRSAYTDRAQVIVQRTGSVNAGRWITERRDVLSDAEQAFGAVPLSATLLAVASDTDNTREEAHAGFADMHFVAKGRPCAFLVEGK